MWTRAPDHVIVFLPLFLFNCVACLARPIDLMFVLDNSASMKQNDPQRLIVGAVPWCASRLPQDSQVGVVFFDRGPHLAAPLFSVSAADFSGQIKNAMAAINYNGLLTDIPGGMERGLYELRTTARQEAQQAIILFTDGFIDLGSAEKDRIAYEWLNSLVDRARKQGVIVFGITLGEHADFHLIEAVSKDTGGDYFRMEKPSEIANQCEKIAALLVNAIPANSEKKLDRGGRKAGEDRSGDQGHSREIQRGPGIRIYLLFVASLIVVAFLSRIIWLYWPIPTAILISSDGDSHRIRKRIYRIGRWRFAWMRHNDLAIQNLGVSRAHAQIRYRHPRFWLRDDFSATKTCVSKRELKPGEEVILECGATVKFGKFEYEFVYDESFDSRKRTREEESSEPSKSKTHKWNGFELCERHFVEAQICEPREAEKLKQELIRNGRNRKTNQDEPGCYKCNTDHRQA